MKYCTRCVMPDTRPGINFNEKEVCNFCRYYESLDKVDWDGRKKQLMKIAEWARSKNTQYDCVVGVSGGKDSMYMSLYARDVLKLRVLLASMVPDNITENGRHNIDNLQRMGFDCFLFRPNPKVCKKLAKMAFYKWGNPVKPSEYALYATPIRAASMYKVPLLLFDNDWTFLDDATKDKSGGDASTICNCNTLGWTGNASHLFCEGVTLEDLASYQYPSQEEIKQADIKMIYLAYFVRWSVREHGTLAIARGLSINTDELSELGRYTRYNSLDDDTGIMNQMLKHIKLGYGFATDEACVDIWDGRITRDEAVKLVRQYDGKCGIKYIKKFCDYIDITLDEFWNVADKFRGPMWKKNKIGLWELENPVE
ncbi:MAG: N-acetyl sugar amidotransferase [Desulfobacteraceae bacterium]|nr:N-acetyl sugar amidotransferase [Desulfobacteraceae bacterium]